MRLKGMGFRFIYPFRADPRCSLGQVRGDGEPTCFSNVKDTGIPDLQKWCHQLTFSSRERAATTFLTQIRTFVQSIETYVKGIGDITAVDREALREKWESRGLDEQPRDRTQDEENPLAAVLGGLGADLGVDQYGKQIPKVNPNSQPTGVTARLCTVRLHPMSIWSELNWLTGICQTGGQLCSRSPAKF